MNKTMGVISMLGVALRRLKRLIAILVPLLVVVLTFAWQEALSIPPQVEPMAEGAKHVSIVLPGQDKATLSIVRFHADKFQMRVVNNPPAKKVQLADMAKAAKAIGACNGGYFNVKEFTPLGIGIAQGVSQGTFQSCGKEGALFGIKNGVPFIISESEYQPSPEITDLVQCSPILVDQQYVFHNGGPASTFRTFVMTDGAGQWAIGSGSHLTLDELATLLVKPDLLEDFHVKRAMNLDGGPSTALWWRDADGQEHEQREAWKVVNMVLVVPR